MPRDPSAHPQPPGDTDPAGVHALLPTDMLPATTPFLTLDDLRDALAARISALLDRQPELLMSILYRIDVAETAVQEALASSPPDQLAPTLADLVIDRQVQKLHWRRRYSGGTDRNPDRDAPF